MIHSTMAAVDVLTFEIGNCFCCVCGEMYLYDESKILNGRPCTCVCLCGELTKDAWYEIHMEVTETCCLRCENYFAISCSTWDYERGKHEHYCSDKCGDAESESESEIESE